MLDSSSSTGLENKPLRQKFTLSPLAIHCAQTANLPPSIKDPQTSRDVFENGDPTDIADADSEAGHSNEHIAPQSGHLEKGAVYFPEERSTSAVFKNDANVTIDIGPLKQLFNEFSAKYAADERNTGVIHPFAFATACYHAIHQDRLDLLGLFDYQSLDSYIWNLATKLSGSYDVEIKHLSRSPNGDKLKPKEDILSIEKLGSLFNEIHAGKTTAVEMSIFIRWVELMT